MNKLKLEVGKCYKARNGEKVEIVDYRCGWNYPFIGITQSGRKITYTEEGIRVNDVTLSRLDLISEWDDPKKSILQEAETLINGDRAADYGDAKENFENIAKGWSVLFGKEVTARQVGLAMAWLKICRENNNHKLDNLVDLAGYASLIAKL